MYMCVIHILRHLKKEVTWVIDIDLSDLVSGDLIFKMFIPLRN